MPRVIEVIQDVELLGEGTKKSPRRAVFVYYSRDGELLAKAEDPAQRLLKKEAK